MSAATPAGHGPLAGLRVLDVGTRIGAPFCAGLLGEWGAEVVKVEQPGGGDFMRGIGPFADGYSLFWAVEGRGRKSVTCDLRTPKGQDLFRRLAALADVVVENFRPGTMEGWGIGPADLDPRLVMVRISAFGQDGPNSQRPGLDRLGVAFGGLLHLTGEPDRPPVRPGVTVADYLTGVFAAEAALAALYRRDARGTGTGAVVDASLYGSILRILEWTIPAYDRLGTIRSREGNRMGNSAPLDNYRAADGQVVCIVGGSDANYARLCRAMDRPDLLEDERFRTLKERARHGDLINDIVAAWVAARPAAEVEAACVANDVPVATAYTARDITLDPHMAARGDLVEIQDPVAGALRQQAPYPRLIGEARPVPSGAPQLGADNKEVWCDLVGLSSDELAELQQEGIV
ncbi:MAG TPA: CaiB/BaiF CoA-transferase family protein [Acidimicrobiales bacterium]|nr:CaiB/BaiF CoA-transferase family protein [Acidimicrobiales bacterium]